MEDLSLRAAFHRALDPVAPPAPWLPETVMSDLRNRRLALASTAQKRRGIERRWTVSPRVLRFAAVAVILAMIVASLAAFAALNLYLHRNIPVRLPNRVSRACPSFATYVSPTGARWQGKQPPKVNGWQAGDQAECVADPTHAWTTETSEAAAGPVIVVMSTRDGGQSWTQGQALPAATSNVRAWLDFSDGVHGWLLLDALTQRTLFSSSDGGIRWTQMTSANNTQLAALSTIASYCPETGLVMTPSGTGWVTFDVCRAGAGPVVASTTDGGRTWVQASLPRVATFGAQENCSAAPPVISGTHVALPFACFQSDRLAGVFRSSDGGQTWTLGQLPFFANGGVVFADGLNGFVLQPRQSQTATSGSALYRTADGGKTWTVVIRNLFSGHDIQDYGFTDSRNGYAVVAYGVGPRTLAQRLTADFTGTATWFTHDGGLTWTVAPPLRSVRQTLCSTPNAPPSPGNALNAPVMFGTATGWDAGARHTTDGGAHWTTDALPPPPLQTAGYGEDFLDANDAWAAIAAGSSEFCADHVVVFKTSDGGQNWQHIAWVDAPPKDPSQDLVTSVFFKDRQNGWLYTSTDGVFRTSDGGADWTAISPAPTVPIAGCSAGPGIYFAGATNGWLQIQCANAVNPGPYRLLVTRDGGVTWAVQTIASNASVLSSVLPIFTDSRHGYVWDPAVGLLEATSDGGVTWSLRTPPISGYPCLAKGGVQGFCSNESVAAVTFLNSSVGWAVIGAFSFPQGKGGPIDVANRFVRTTNGGRSWSVISRLPTAVAPDNGSSTLQFVDANDGFWLWGDRWYRTRDGGRSWTLAFTGAFPTPAT